jgi:hypothetical protein
MMRRFFQMLILVILPYVLLGQYFLELHAESDHSFREWEILLEKDSTELEGQLSLTWAINNDFSQWQYSIGDRYGEISQKFRNNPGFWELRSEGEIVTIMQVWPGDITEWKISRRSNTFVFKTIHPNRLDEWSIPGNEYGEFIFYTETLGDPRDWIVSDYTIAAVTFEERLAAIFIALYSSIPKY